MKLHGITKSKITKEEDDEIVPHLKIAKVALIYCDIVSNDYQHNSRVLSTFAPNKLFDQLLDISTKNFIF